MSSYIVYQSSSFPSGELEAKAASGIAIRFTLSEWQTIAPCLPVGTYSVTLDDGEYPVLVRRTDNFPKER